MKIEIDKKKLKFIISITAIVLLLVIMLITIFTRPNLTINDITEPQKLSVLMKYGLPTGGTQATCGSIVTV